MCGGSHRNVEVSFRINGPDCSEVLLHLVALEISPWIQFLNAEDFSANAPKFLVILIEFISLSNTFNPLTENGSHVCHLL